MPPTTTTAARKSARMAEKRATTHRTVPEETELLTNNDNTNLATAVLDLSKTIKDMKGQMLELTNNIQELKGRQHLDTTQEAAQPPLQVEGPCIFDDRGQNSGCSSANLIPPESLSTLEITKTQCQDTCLASLNEQDVECWAYAFLPGYNGDDCWMFNSKSTDYCYDNQGAYAGVTLHIKNCFGGEMRTLTTELPATGQTDEETTVPTTESSTTSWTTEEEMATMTNDIPTTSNTGTTATGCTCECKTTQTTEEIQESLDKIIKELKVDKKNTSLYKRKLTSAPDDRFSSRVIGVSGATILILSILFIFSMDFTNFYNAVKRMCR